MCDCAAAHIIAPQTKIKTFLDTILKKVWAQAKSKSATAVQKKCLTAAGASAAGPAAGSAAGPAAASAGGGGAETRFQAV